MKTITTQEELDEIRRIDEGAIVEITTELRLNAILEVFGVLVVKANLDCSLAGRYVVAMGNASVEAWGNASVEARENASVVAWGNASVEAMGNASVVAWGNASVEARENASVEARENASVVALENASVEAMGNASVEAMGNASVEARENASVVALENASVVARGNASVVAWENAIIRIINASCKAVLHGFSVGFVSANIVFEFGIKSNFAKVQRVTSLDWFERNGVEKTASIIVFKRVSKSFKTQEGTKNETLWTIGTTLTHPSWRPGTGECGEGKYHACSRPYFCDEFRCQKDDRYIAILVSTEDVYESKDPQYPHKICFRTGKVLYECDRFGKKKA